MFIASQCSYSLNTSFIYHINYTITFSFNPSASEFRPKTSQPLEPSINPDHAELDQLVRRAVEKLSVFEKRAKIEQPLKYSKLQRLVFGAREIMRELEKFALVPNQSFPIKMLIVANNVQTDAQIVAQIQKMKIACNSHKVPVVDKTLSKNQIGKIAGKSIRQSVVAVINAEGARDEIVRVKELISS
jgi:ribosomal protein L7Ae-like RNA K-turn-binding protein